MTSLSASQSPSKTPGWHRPDKLFRRIQLGRKRNKPLAPDVAFSGVSKDRGKRNCDSSAVFDFGKRRLQTSLCNVEDDICDKNPFLATPGKFSSRAKRFKPAPTAGSHTHRPILDDCNTVADPADFPRLFRLLGNGGSRYSKDATGSCSQPTDFSSMLEDENSHSVLDPDAEAARSAGTSHNSNQTYSTLPLYFSLATKLRILTCDPLPGWISQWDPDQTVEGGVFGRINSKRSTSSANDCGLAALHHSMAYCSFPSLPKLPNFPRLGSLAGGVGKYGLPARPSVGREKMTFSSALSPAMMKDFGEQWHDCLHTLRKLLESGRCPYFYLCCPNCTILMVAAGVDGTECMSAVITPTTKGLRHALRDDDIEYFMPLRRRSGSSSSLLSSSLAGGGDCSNSQQLSALDVSGHPLLQHSVSLMEPLPSAIVSCEDGEETVEDDHNTSGELDFLEEVGISPRYRNKFKKRIERSDSVENRGEPTVVIYDVTENSRNNVKKFISFVCNDFKHLWATVGPQSGHPPTLISPVQFVGGTLHSLKMSTGTVKRESITINSVELAGGPLLPTAVFSLCAHLEKHLKSFSVQWLGAEMYHPLNAAVGLWNKISDSNLRRYRGRTSDEGSTSEEGIAVDLEDRGLAEDCDKWNVNEWLELGSGQKFEKSEAAIDRNCVYLRKMTYKDGVYHIM